MRIHIVSWNVNGLRSVAKKGFLSWVSCESPDILCLQETKADAEQIPDDVRYIDGYTSFFSSAKSKKGYSGVALYTKIPLREVRLGMGVKRFDDEGRIIEADFDKFTLLNVYFPNGGGGPERLQYKLDFYDAFLAHIDDLRRRGKRVIFCGDVNTAHEEIDLARPKENEKNTGFLPEERAWIDEVVSHGYVDVFRHFHPHKADAYTYWDMKTRARERNVGWRIDYFFVGAEVLPWVTRVGIRSDIFGSDHCPIYLDLLI
jgi:exodeoxyribonuclease-3